MTRETHHPLVDFRQGYPKWDIPSWMQNHDSGTILEAQNQTPKQQKDMVARIVHALVPFAKELGIRHQDIRIFPHASAGLRWAIHGLTEPEDTVLMPTPVFFESYKITKALRRNVQLMQWPIQSDGSLNKESLEKHLSRKPKLFVITNPNNPLGEHINLSDIQAVTSLANKYGVAVLADQVFEPFDSTIVRGQIERASPNTWAGTTDTSKRIPMRGRGVAAITTSQGLASYMDKMTKETHEHNPDEGAMIHMDHVLSDTRLPAQIETWRLQLRKNQSRLATAFQKVGWTTARATDVNAFLVAYPPSDLHVQSDEAARALLHKHGIIAQPLNKFFPGLHTDGPHRPPVGVRLAMARPESMIDQAEEIISNLPTEA